MAPWYRRQIVPLVLLSGLLGGCHEAPRRAIFYPNDGDRLGSVPTDRGVRVRAPVAEVPPQDRNHDVTPFE